MGDGSMFEEPDFGRAQSGGQPSAGPDDTCDDEGLEDVEDLEDEEDVEGADEDDEDDEDDGDADDGDADRVVEGMDVVDDEDADDLGDVNDLVENDLEADDDLDDIDDEPEDGAVNRLRGAAAKAVLDHVTRTLVDDPDSVVVDVSEGRSGLRFSVHVAPGDMGRLIGRKGRTAQAIRALVRAAAASDGTEASVDIVD